MTKSEEGAASRDWVELKLQLSLKDYVTQGDHKHDIERLQDKHEKNVESIGNKLDWRIYLASITTIALGLLGVIYKSFGASLD